MNANNSNNQTNNELLGLDNLLGDQQTAAIEQNTATEDQLTVDTDIDVKVEETKTEEAKAKSKNLGLKYGAAAAMGVGVAAAGAYAIDGMNNPAAMSASDVDRVLAGEDVEVDPSMNERATPEEIDNILRGIINEEEVVETPAQEEIVDEVVVEEQTVETPAEEIVEEAVAEEQAVEVIAEEEIVEAVVAEEEIIEAPVEEVVEASEEAQAPVVDEVPATEFEVSEEAVAAEVVEEQEAEDELEGEESDLDVEVAQESQIDLAEVSMEDPNMVPDATLQFNIEDVNFSNAVNDDMSFAQAFASARADVGSNGVFEWRGGVYGTFYQDEWDNISEEYKEEFNNHNWRAEFDLETTNVVEDHNTAAVVEGPDPVVVSDGPNAWDEDLLAHLPNYIPEDGSHNVMEDINAHGVDYSNSGLYADNIGHGVNNSDYMMPNSLVPELVADSVEALDSAYILTEDPNVEYIAMAEEVLNVLPVDISENADVDIDVHVLNVIPEDSMPDVMDCMVDDLMI